MPTDLPQRPHLDHLKKQAKALLDAFRNSEPQAVAAFRDLNPKDAPKLADAQRLIARQYGFKSWNKLKEHIEALTFDEAVQLAKKALRDDDPATLRRVLKRYPALRKNINAPVGDFNSPLIIHVRGADMLDVLLEAGADINARSRWWAGGFGVLDTVEPSVARHAIQRGALVTVHAAARLGMIERVRELVEADPALVHARGGDGQTPLHFALSIEIAAFLLDHGAEIEARDVDHVSTPVQYMVRDRPEVARYLVGRGATADLLLAAALGDLKLVEQLLRADPESIRMRVSSEWFSLGGFNGGTIYQWHLGWHVSACQVAKVFKHEDVFQLLMERSPEEERLLNACWLHDDAMVKAILSKNPDLASALPAAGRRQLAHAARNNDGLAAELMLEANLPLDANSQSRGTALHWASWHGNASLVRQILKRRPNIEGADNEWNATPLGWAMHGSLNGWYLPAGDHGQTVEALLDAGARVPEKISGSEAVLSAFERHGLKP